MNKKELMFVAVAGIASYFIFKYLLSKNSAALTTQTYSDLSSQYSTPALLPGSTSGSSAVNYMVA